MKGKPVPCEYSHPSSFHWQSDLGPKRKQELIDWEASLTDNDRRKLRDLLDDARAHEAGYAAEEAAGESM